MIQYPSDSKPHIKWDHIDGPLLYCADGQIHWLTLLERLYFKMGLITLEELDRKYRTDIPQRG